MVYQLLSSHPESKFPTLGCGNPRLGGGPGYAFEYDTSIVDHAFGRFNLVKITDPAVFGCFLMFLVLVPDPIFKGYRGSPANKQRVQYLFVWEIPTWPVDWSMTDPLDPKIQAEHLWFPEVGVWVLCQGRLGTASATWQSRPSQFPAFQMGLCHQKIAVLIGEMLNNWWIWRVPYFQTKPCCDDLWCVLTKMTTSGYYILDFGPSHWKDFSSENCPEFIRVPLSDWIVLYPYYLYLNEALFQWVCRFRFLHHPNNSSSDAGSPSPRGFRTPSFAPHCGDWHRFLFFFAFFWRPHVISRFAVTLVAIKSIE